MLIFWPFHLCSCTLTYVVAYGMGVPEQEIAGLQVGIAMPATVFHYGCRRYRSISLEVYQKSQQSLVLQILTERLNFETATTPRL